MRRRLAGLGLAAVLIAPPAALAFAGLAAGEVLHRATRGAVRAVDQVGWVVVPQLLLGTAILGLALRRLVELTAGARTAPEPAWLAPAVESALLLGMLGTISGMVRGFVGLSPEEIEPGPLVHSLGTALRSSFVGFGIALVGVWTRGGDGSIGAKVDAGSGGRA